VGPAITRNSSVTTINENVGSTSLVIGPAAGGVGGSARCVSWTGSGVDTGGSSALATSRLLTGDVASGAGVDGVHSADGSCGPSEEICRSRTFFASRGAAPAIAFSAASGEATAGALAIPVVAGRKRTGASD